MGKWRYGVILDAGSSGTRVHIYRWLSSTKARQDAGQKELKSLPVLKTKKNWTEKIRPGVSTFNTKPDLVGPDHLRALITHALDVIPNDAVEHTPMFLLATAGMRLLPEFERKELLAQICSYVRSSTRFLLPDCDLHIQVIPGETEGLYGWIAANYLLGGFDSPEDHLHGKGHHTYGFLDMGGASAQIAFAPNTTEAERHADDLKMVRLRTLDGAATEYKVFVKTWLGFGVNEARRRFVEALLEASASYDAKELPDPCLPVGLSVTKEGRVVNSGSGEAQEKELHLIGTGRFDECLRQTYPLLDKDAPCERQPCLLHGVHVPTIDFDVNHFVGVSEYWHTTHEIFEMSHKDKSYDFNTYQTRVKEFCSQDWTTISRGIAHHKWGKKVDETTALEVCFKASWLINVLHNGIGIPRIGLENIQSANHNDTKEILQHATEKGFLDPFQAVNEIDNTEVSWTLGKMVLYAASQISPLQDTLPVGFGSNGPGVPSDFQFAGSALSSSPEVPTIVDDNDDGNWHKVLFDSDSPRRIPGFIFVLLIICIAVFLLCGRDRRTRIYRRLRSVFGRSRTSSRRRKFFSGKLLRDGNSGIYERVLEDGDAPEDFELGEVDSENDHSDSSGASRAARSSGWATPRVKVVHEHGSSDYFDTALTQGIGLGLNASHSAANAMDRSGLVVRTESRERLVLDRPGSGRRSRTGSPNRHHKSPLMAPPEEPYD
ncbi:MAG: Golgi apyrase [Pycnora praestabilis]|nr:MAG: Golgi apyrase [Pycnora praestabilis]